MASSSTNVSEGETQISNATKLNSPIAFDEAAVVTSASKVSAYLQKHRARKLVAALSFGGSSVGFEGGALGQMAIVIGDSATFTTGDNGEWNVGEPELVALLDMSKLSPTMFKLSGLEDALKADGVLKIMHDSRLPSVALSNVYKMRPTPVFDTAIADILFRQEDKEKRLSRMHSSFHFQVFQSPALKNSLANLCRMNNFREALVEHGVVDTEALKDNAEKPFTVVHEAIALYRLYKKFEANYRNSNAFAFSELVHWSANLVNYYSVPKPNLPKGKDGKTVKIAKTGEGLTQVIYDYSNILPLAVMPRRSAIGDGSQLQVGRISTVDQHTRVCKGCQRKIGPCNDCFEPKAEYCYLCYVLNWSFRYRTEGKGKESIADIVAAVNAAQDAKAAAMAALAEAEQAKASKRAAEAVEQQEGQPRRKKIYKEKRRR